VLVPKLITTTRAYSLAQFRADATAGLIVGIVAIPLAIAFAIASGVSPDRGLVTAVVGGLLISVLGGSRVQIGGPTGAFVVIVYGVVQQHGVDGLLIATIMAGFLLVALGVARVGAVIKFIPFPVTVGFTSGIALIIFSSQVKRPARPRHGRRAGRVRRQVGGPTRTRSVPSTPGPSRSPG
jgi:sulfate permease, SulP family